MMCAVCMFDGRRQADQIEQLQQDLAAAQEEAQYRGFLVRDLLPYQERAVKAESDLAAARARNKECDLLLSRVLHELAGSASLCWEPKPTGVFATELALGFVEDAIKELRAVLAGEKK